MDYSRKISQRLWNLPEKGEQESHREETFIDDIVQKSFIERKLLENLVWRPCSTVARAAGASPFCWPGTAAR